MLRSLSSAARIEMEVNMQYQTGKIGRAIVARIDHGDDLLGELRKLIQAEQVKLGIMFMIGALEGAALVVGPEKATVPPEPVWKQFADGREIVGIGTVFWSEDEPVIHLHASLGRGDAVLTGCVRGESQVYLVVEVVILELADINAARSIDPSLGMSLLSFF
jgi:uncharacterized protein